MILDISVNEERFTRKPTSADAGRITREFQFTEMSVKELIAHIEAGRSFCPAVFIDDIKNDANVVSLQCYAVDVDSSKLTPHEFFDRLPDFFKPQFAYYTLSHGIKPDNRFRLVFVFDEILMPGKTTENEIRKIVSVLFKICKEIDPGKNFENKVIIDGAATSLSQMFYGSNRECIWFDDYFVCIEDLIDYMGSPDKIVQTYEIHDGSYSVLQRLVKVYLVGACSDILHRCGKRGRGAGADISLVARFLVSFKDDRDIRKRLQTVIDEYPSTFDEVDQRQFNRIFDGGAQRDFNDEYWLEQEQLVRLITNLIDKEPLTQELCEDIMAIITQKTIPHQQRILLQGKLKNAIRLHNARATQHNSD